MSEEKKLPGLRALVVEDDASNRYLISQHLRSIGLLVREARNRDEAFRAFLAIQHIDIVVIDRCLASNDDDDGLHLLGDINDNRNGRDILAIVISGHDRVGLDVEAANLGDAIFLPKPFARDDLLRPIFEWAGERSTAA